MRNRMLKNKYLFSAVVFIVILAMTLLTLVAVHSHTVEKCWEDLRSAALAADIQVTDIVNNTFANLENKALMMSTAENLESPEVANEIERNTIGDMQMEMRLYFPDGKAFTASGIIDDVSGSIDYVDVLMLMEEKNRYVSCVKNDFINEKMLVMEFFSPVIKNGRIIAIASAVMDLNELQSHVVSYAYSGKSYIYCVDKRDGSFFVDTDHKRLVKAESYENHVDSEGNSLRPYFEKVMNGQEAYATVISSNHGTVGYLYSIPSDANRNWSITIGVAEEQAFDVDIYVRRALTYLSLAELIIYFIYLVWLSVSFWREHSGIMKSAQSANEKVEEQRELLKDNYDIINALADEYNAVYRVDVSNGKITPYSTDDESRDVILTALKRSSYYRDIFAAYVENFVYESDKEMMLREGSIENVTKRLAEGNSHIITYRGVYGDVVSFCELKYITVNKENEEIKSFVVGFTHKDDEIMAQYINEKLITEYISAFMVDLDNDKYRIYRHPNTTKVMDREDRIWSLAMTDFAAECDPEYFEIVKNIGTPEFLKKELANVDRREYQYRFPSATQPWRRSVVQVIDRKDGVPSNIVATFMGIDDYQSQIYDQQRKLTEQQEQLANALSMAEAANRAKTTFLNNMSHDIRTPMNAIMGFTTLASRNIDNRELVRDYLSKIAQSSEHLLDLINDVLDMSRIEAGKMVIEEKAENLSEIINTIKDITLADINAKQLDFTVEIVNVEDTDIICDKLRLDQVLINILSNAIKYTPAGGKITMRITEKAANEAGYGTYEFYVRDNGMGMTKEFLKHIFEPFERVKSSTVSGIQGTGLGMAISKNIVDMMGGYIDVKSHPEKGTEVTVILNFRLQQQTKETINAKQYIENEKNDKAGENRVDFRGRKLLLVEDNELNREIATEILKDEGFDVDTAEDGVVAVEKMRDAKPGEYDLILMDIQMPRMDGYEATRKIRELPPESERIPIIAMTANAFDEDRKHALSVGMDDHVAKPININELNKILEKHL